jgi:hypothetical protein
METSTSGPTGGGIQKVQALVLEQAQEEISIDSDQDGEDGAEMPDEDVIMEMGGALDLSMEAEHIEVDDGTIGPSSSGVRTGTAASSTLAGADINPEADEEATLLARLDALREPKMITGFVLQPVPAAPVPRAPASSHKRPREPASNGGLDPQCSLMLLRRHREHQC